MQLQTDDLQYIVARLPAPIRHLLEERGRKLMLGGGFIRACIASEEPSDIDLFSPSEDAAVDASNNLVTRLGGEMEVLRITTANAITIRAKGRSMLPIQFIHRWTFSSPVDMIASFDFTIAKAGVWYVHLAAVDPQHFDRECNPPFWMSVCDERFYPDLAAKRLVYTSPVREEEPGGSMLRVMKFMQRGYRIPPESLAAVIARLIGKIDEDPLGGAYLPGESSEVAKARVIQGLLRDVDPLVDPGHILH